MKIRLENPQEYTAGEVHAAMKRAFEKRDKDLAMLGERFLRGESSDDYPPHMRVIVEDSKMIAWALGQVWEGLAVQERAS